MRSNHVREGRHNSCKLLPAELLLGPEESGIGRQAGQLRDFLQPPPGSVKAVGPP